MSWSSDSIDATVKHCKQSFETLNQVLEQQLLPRDKLRLVLQDAEVVSQLRQLLDTFPAAGGAGSPGYKAVESLTVNVPGRSKPVSVNNKERADFILDFAMMANLEETRAAGIVRASRHWRASKVYTPRMLTECCNDYYLERMWLLRCLETILRIAAVPGHAYQEDAATLIGELRRQANGGPPSKPWFDALVQKLVESLEQFHARSPPPMPSLRILVNAAKKSTEKSLHSDDFETDARVATFNQHHVQDWAHQQLVEYAAILNILFLSIYGEEGVGGLADDAVGASSSGVATGARPLSRNEAQQRFLSLSRWFLEKGFGPVQSHSLLLPSEERETVRLSRKIEHLGVLCLLAALQLSLLWPHGGSEEDVDGRLRAQVHPIFEVPVDDEGGGLDDGTCLRDLRGLMGGGGGISERGFEHEADRWYTLHGRPPPHGLVIMAFILASNDEPLRTLDIWALQYLRSMLMALRPDDTAVVVQGAHAPPGTDGSEVAFADSTSDSWFVLSTLSSATGSEDLLNSNTKDARELDAMFADGGREGAGEPAAGVVDDEGNPVVDEPSLNWDPDTDAIRSVIYEVLCGLVLRKMAYADELSREDMVHELTDLLAEVYANDSELCRSFWGQASEAANVMHAAMFPLLKAARERYPYDSRTLLKMCTSLCGDGETADRVFNYLGGFFGRKTTKTDEPISMQYFTQERPPWADDVMPWKVLGGDPEVPRVRLIEELAYTLEQVTLPRGTEGHWMGDVVAWEFEHSAWPVLLARLSAISRYATEHGVRSVGEVGAEEALGTVSLMVRLFSRNPALIDEMVLHLEAEWRHSWLHEAGLDEWDALMEAQDLRLQDLAVMEAHAVARRLECESVEDVAPIMQKLHEYRRSVRAAGMNSTDGSSASHQTDAFVAPLQWLCKQLLSLLWQFSGSSSPIARGKEDSADTGGASTGGSAWRQDSFARLSHAVVVSCLQALSCLADRKPDETISVLEGSDADWGNATDSTGKSHAVDGRSSGVNVLFEVLGTVLRDTECLAQTYPATLTALELLRQLVRSVIQRRVSIDLHGPFDMFDEDGGGTIDTEEFAQSMEMLGFNLSPAAMKQLMHELDANGDHQIEYHEFVHFALERGRSVHVQSDYGTGQTAGLGTGSVARELQDFLAQIMGRTQTRIDGDQRLVSVAVEFCHMCFVGHSTWSYIARNSRWRIARASLRVLRDILQDFSEPRVEPERPVGAAMRGSGRPSVDERSHSRDGLAGSASRPSDKDYATTKPGTIRETVLSAFLSDSGLQTALTEAAMLLASSAFDNHCQAIGGAKVDQTDYEAASRVLPLDFLNGILGPIRDTHEKQLVEELAEEALGVLQLVLNSGEHSSGANSSVAWRAPSKVAMLTKQIAASRSGPASRRGLPGAEDSVVSASNFNMVVALAGLVSYPQAGNARIPLRAVRLLTLLCRCMSCAMEQTAAKGPYSKRDTRRTQYSLTAFLNIDGPALRQQLFMQRSIRRGEVTEQWRVANLRLKIAALEFSRAVVETQPGFAGMVLDSRSTASAGSEEAVGGFNVGDTTFGAPSAITEALAVVQAAAEHVESEPQLLSVALNFLLSLWRRGTETRQHLGVVAALRQHAPFWHCLDVLDLPLDEKPPIPVDEGVCSAFASMSGVPTTAQAEAVRDRPLSSDEVASYCYALSARTAAFHILALELYHFRNHEPCSALVDRTSAWQSAGTLNKWQETHCDFSFNERVTLVIDRVRKNGGVELSPFRVRGDDSSLDPPARRYGVGFVYDVPLLSRRLGVDALWLRGRDIVERAATEAGAFDIVPVEPLNLVHQGALSVCWVATLGNCCWSIADAQLEALRAWKTCMEIACRSSMSKVAAKGQVPAAPAVQPKVLLSIGDDTAKAIVQGIAPVLASEGPAGNIVAEATLDLAGLLSAILHSLLHSGKRSSSQKRSGASIAKFDFNASMLLLNQLHAASNKLLDVLRPRDIPVSGPEATRLRRGQVPEGLAGALGLTSRQLTIGLELRLSLMTSMLYVFRSLPVATPQREIMFLSGMNSLGSVGAALEDAEAEHARATKVARAAQKVLQPVIECMQLADITQPETNAVQAQVDPAYADLGRSGVYSRPKHRTFDSLTSRRRRRPRRHEVYSRALDGTSGSGQGRAEVSHSASSRSKSDREHEAKDGYEREQIWGPVGGALFRVCVALLDVLVQRLGPVETYLPILHESAVLPTLLRAFSSATTAAASTFQSFADAWAEMHEPGTKRAAGERFGARRPTDGGSKDDPRRWRSMRDRSARGRFFEEEPALPSDSTAWLTDRAYRAVEEYMARAEVVLQTVLLLCEEPLACFELHRCGLSRLLLADPMLRRMESTLREREAVGGWQAMGSARPYAGFSFGSDGSAYTGSARAAADSFSALLGGNSQFDESSRGYSSDHNPVAQGVAGSVSAWDAHSKQSWEGRGFGLGPSVHRGYTGRHERSAAHRVWCLCVKLMGSQLRTLDRVQRSQLSRMSGRTDLPVADIRDSVLRFVDLYSCTLRTSLSNRLLTLASMEESSVSARLASDLMCSHLPQWRLHSSRALSRSGAQEAFEAGALAAATYVARHDLAGLGMGYGGRDIADLVRSVKEGIAERDLLGSLLLDEAASPSRLSAGSGSDETEAIRSQRFPGLIDVFVRLALTAAADIGVFLADRDEERSERRGGGIVVVAVSESERAMRVRGSQTSSSGATDTTWSDTIDRALSQPLRNCLDLAVAAMIPHADTPLRHTVSHDEIDEDDLRDAVEVAQSAVEKRASSPTKAKRARPDPRDRSDYSTTDHEDLDARTSAADFDVETDETTNQRYSAAERMLQVAKACIFHLDRRARSSVRNNGPQAEVARSVLRSAILLLARCAEQIATLDAGSLRAGELAKEIQRVCGNGGEELTSGFDGTSDTGTETTHTTATHLGGMEKTERLGDALQDKGFAYCVVRYLLLRLRHDGRATARRSPNRFRLGSSVGVSEGYGNTRTPPARSSASLPRSPRPSPLSPPLGARLSALDAPRLR